MTIDYIHSQNLHTREGARAAFAALFEGIPPPASVLDVGCGAGTWLRAALDSGLSDILGIDGVQIPAHELLIPASAFRCLDLTRRIKLDRKFDLVLCLEVGEHLEQSDADTLLDTLTRHSDHIVFSAACPGQPGQHHVNCQWPQWWQERFNARGYVCDDAIRSSLWEESNLEPWYRQNIFSARKDPERASLQEPRLKRMIHPDMLPRLTEIDLFKRIERGGMPMSWYLGIPFRALTAKVSRRMFAL